MQKSHSVHRHHLPLDLYNLIIEKLLEDFRPQPRCLLLVNRFFYKTTLHYLNNKNYLIQRILNLLEKISFFQQEEEINFQLNRKNEDYLTRLYKCLRLLSGVARYKDSERILRDFTDYHLPTEWSEFSQLKNFLKAKYYLDPYFNRPDQRYFKRQLGWVRQRCQAFIFNSIPSISLLCAAYQRLILLLKFESRLNHSSHSLVKATTREYAPFIINRLWHEPHLTDEQEAFHALLLYVKKGLGLFDKHLISNNGFNKKQMIALAGPYTYQILVFLRDVHSNLDDPWFTPLLKSTPETLFYISNYPYTSAHDVLRTLKIVNPVSQKKFSHNSSIHSNEKRSEKIVYFLEPKDSSLPPSKKSRLH